MVNYWFSKFLHSLWWCWRSKCKTVGLNFSFSQKSNKNDFLFKYHWNSALLVVAMLSVAAFYEKKNTENVRECNFLLFFIIFNYYYFSFCDCSAAKQLVLHFLAHSASGHILFFPILCLAFLCGYTLIVTSFSVLIFNVNCYIFKNQALRSYFSIPFMYIYQLLYNFISFYGYS